MTIGITFGAFDPLHIGHINLIKNSLKQCDSLIVCVSSDEYIRTIKKYEPKFSYEERIVALSMIKGVSKIEMQGLDYMHSKKQLVKKNKANIIFVGSDWSKETFKGEGLGVPVVYLPRTIGVSGTELRETMNMDKDHVCLFNKYQQQLEKALK